MSTTKRFPLAKFLPLILAISLSLSVISCKSEFLAPDFKMQNKAGEDIMLSDFAGEPILLNFWASWCPPCQTEMPDFEDAYKKYGDRVNFVIVNLSGEYETVEVATDFIEQKGYTFPVYFDVYGDGTLAYGLSTIPQTFFIGADGELKSSYDQAISKEILEERIAEILE